MAFFWIKHVIKERRKDIILFIALVLLIALAFGAGVMVGKNATSPQIIIQQIK